MLTFEKVLEVFQAYLDDDPLYEVVQTSHGYTLMAWEPHRNDWYSAEIQKTPEDLRNALPYPAHGFLCWSTAGECLRTRMKKIHTGGKTDDARSPE